MLNFDVKTVGPLGCNCVILWDPHSKLGVVVDPGDESERIANSIKELDISVQAILLTHAHFDHVGACASLQKLWNCPVCLHPEDIPMLKRLDAQTAGFGMPPIEKPEITPLGDPLPLGIQALHTPGHSPGSATFLADTTKGKAALTGDTLFAQGVGRSDLWGGSWETLEQSILTQLYTLDPQTLVIPGHGPNTSIASERNCNPYVRA